MSLRPEPLPPLPDATAAAVRAAFPTGNLAVELRTEFSPLDEDALCADRYPAQGRPVAVAPGRLARVMVMPSIAGRPERQAADAVRRGMEGNEALSLDLHDSGVDVTLGHDGRHRWRAHAAAPRLLETFLTTGTARGWRHARSTQRTDSTHVVAAMRPRPRLACVLEARPAALNPLRAAAPGGGQPRVARAWYDRDGLRADQGRLPQEARPREARAHQVGGDGYQLRDRVWAAERAPCRRDLPA